MKKVSSIFFLSLILLQSGGLLFCYQGLQIYSQYKMQLEMSSRKGEYRQITLTRQEYLQDKINENEISIEGEIYDIAFASLKGDKMNLLVVHDEFEQAVIDAIRFVTSAKTQHEDGYMPELLKTISFVYIYNFESSLPVIPSVNSVSYRFISSIQPLILDDVVCPPPEAC